MGLDHGAGGRVESGVAPGPLNGENLADRVGRGDALALAVGRGAQATDDRVDRIAVALGIFQALEQENRAALAHHKAVGPIAEGAGAGSAERADLAELHKGGRPHVAVDAAGQHGVHPVIGEQFHGGVDSGEGGGAGGIGDKVRAAQVQQVGHAPGHDIRQLAGHRVLGDLRQRAIHLGVELRDQLGLGGGGQRAKDRGGAQQSGILGEDHPLVGQVVQLAAHRRAEDHAGVLGVERSVGVAIIAERLGSGGRRPLLAGVHGLGDLWRHAVALPVEGEVAHPATDLRVGLIGGSRIGVVVVSDSPAVGGRLGDAVTSVDDICPEGSGVRRIGEDRAEANNGYGAPSDLIHGATPNIF